MPEKRANIVVYKKRNKLLEHKKILIILVIVLIAIPITVALALTQQNFFKFADAGAAIEKVEIHPGVINIDVNSTSPIYLSTLAYDTFNDPIYYLDDIIYEWSMSSTNSVGTLTNTNGQISEFKPLAYGCGELTVTARWANEVVTKSISVAVSDGANIPNCTGEVSPTIEPTVPVCTQSTIPPETGSAPLTVFLHGSGTAGGSDSTIEGYQWDFENDGTWDTEVVLDPINNVYKEPGIYEPKYRILGANGLYSEICSYKYQVVVEEPDPTILNFKKIKLHGIGYGGDNTNASGAGNLNPLRITREISVAFESEGGNMFPAEYGDIYYATGSGFFTGSVTLPSDFSTGNYIVKVKSPQYLVRQVDGIIAISKNETTIIPEVSLISGDINDDNSVNLDDYSLLVDCYSDLLPARDCDDESKKTAADLSDDGFVDADDYNLFIRELSVLAGD